MTNQIKSGGEERAWMPTPEAVKDEMARIKRLFDHGDGDKEDLITYAREIVSLRARTPAKAGEDGEAAALRIAWWNDMRDRGVSQDIAIAKINAALSSIEEPRG